MYASGVELVFFVWRNEDFQNFEKETKSVNAKSAIISASRNCAENTKARRPEVDQNRAYGDFEVNSGTTSKRSPTTARSATCMIGASGSLLMATMHLESFIPAR